MARTKRNFGSIGLNHCIIRGIDKRDIFFDDQDRRKMLKGMKEYKEKYNICIGTYVLMQNHVHLLIQGKSADISNFFHSLLISYSSFFNKKYDRVGHLFENRYKNKIIDNERYLKNVVKYIHYNPEKAGVCAYNRYKWSGYQELMNHKTWLDKEFIMLYYSDDIEEAMRAFQNEHLNGLRRYYEDYVEYELVNNLSDEQVKKLIDYRMNEIQNEKNDLFGKEKSNNVLKEVLKVKGVSISQVNRITGINRRLLTKLKDGK